MPAHKAKLETIKASCINSGNAVSGWRKAAANNGWLSSSTGSSGSWKSSGSSGQVIVSFVAGFLVATDIVYQRLNVLMLKLYLLVFGINVNGLMTRQRLWICVTGQSLVTRGLEFTVPATMRGI